MRILPPLAALLLLATNLPAQPKQTREQKVLEDRKKVEADGFWIYNDLQKGFAEAKKTGKPMIVIFRCIPCVECVKLDDDLVNQDQRVRPLLEKFVCVRVVSTNGLDLSLFQYDYDQSFATFFLNADGTIYGRYGTRSHRTSWADDVSIDGLAQALQGALDLHAKYPQNKDALAAKRGPAPEVPSPEQFPALKGKYGATITYEANVVQSCIHCHQVGEAQKSFYRAKKEAIPENLLFPFPHPKNLGLILDPKQKATVLRVEKGTAADVAGFQTGDQLLTLQDQPLLSLADVQWVLHHAPSGANSLKAGVLRDKKPIDVTMKLPDGWRKGEDISWRTSTWSLRRMSTGGMVIDPATADERSKAGAPADGAALRVRFVGQFGPHATAKQAGFLAGDVITAYDGKTDIKHETDLLSYAVTQKKVGDKVAIDFYRNGKKMTLSIPMQE